MKTTNLKYKTIDSLIIILVVGLITFFAVKGNHHNTIAMDSLYRSCNNLLNCDSNPGVGLALIEAGMIGYSFLIIIFLIIVRFNNPDKRLLVLIPSKNTNFKLLVSLFIMIVVGALLVDGFIVLNGKKQSYGQVERGYISYVIDDVICERKDLNQSADSYDVPYTIPSSIIDNTLCTVKNKFRINYAWRLGSSLLIIFIINYMMIVKKEEWAGYSMIGFPVFFFLLIRFIIKIVSAIL